MLGKYDAAMKGELQRCKKKHEIQETALHNFNFQLKLTQRQLQGKVAS